VSQKVSPEDSYMAELSFWTDEGGEFFWCASILHICFSKNDAGCCRQCLCPLSTTQMPGWSSCS
jgi:hypothetical protein